MVSFSIFSSSSFLWRISLSKLMYISIARWSLLWNTAIQQVLNYEDLAGPWEGQTGESRAIQELGPALHTGAQIFRSLERTSGSCSQLGRQSVQTPLNPNPDPLLTKRNFE
jgi:hypothetical protein